MRRPKGRISRILAASAGLLAAAALIAGCGDDSDDGDSDADNAVELSGRIDQVGTKFTGYGFVTRLDGVDPGALTDAGGSEITEKDALITFRFEADLTSRAIVGDSFSVATEGNVSFYLNDQPGADFEDADSFAAGKEVASGKLRATDVVTVYAPNSGIATATGAVELDDSSSFDLGGEDVSIGDSGDTFRLTLTGRGTRTDALIPESHFDFAGQLAPTD